MGRGAFATTIGVALAGLAGCTLLVSFDEPSDVAEIVDDSGVATTFDAPPPGDGAPAGDAASAADARPSDFPPECKTPPTVFGFCAPGGMVCGRRVTDYPADGENDLLRCEGVFTCTARCPIGCVAVNGFDDQCDPCSGRADGTYCGRDVGWSKRNADVAVRCRSGKVASTAVCGENKCQSACTRSEPELPSCCV
ncbi:MAG: hypothetical protein KIT84_32330 [Labilithrix sp.]|nr:hypothetical protein [Labilithrix sp.]MCW5815761.1 hypothetical protein [Labilithrix sp.]